MGSAAFVAGTFGAGFMLDVIAARDLIWLIVTALVVTAVVACALEPLAPRVAAAMGRSSSARPLLRDRAFIAIVAAASLIQASHASITVSPRSTGARRLDGTAIAALWRPGWWPRSCCSRSPGDWRSAVGAAADRRRGRGHPLGRHGVRSALLLLVALQCLHALSFGATFLGTLGLMTRTVPPELGATAQGYLASRSAS